MSTPEGFDSLDAELHEQDVMADTGVLGAVKGLGVLLYAKPVPLLARYVEVPPGEVNYPTRDWGTANGVPGVVRIVGSYYEVQPTPSTLPNAVPQYAWECRFHKLGDKQSSQDRSGGKAWWTPFYRIRRYEVVQGREIKASLLPPNQHETVMLRVKPGNILYRYEDGGMLVTSKARERRLDAFLAASEARRNGLSSKSASELRLWYDAQARAKIG